MESEPNTEAGRTGEAGEDANTADADERDRRAGDRTSGDAPADPGGASGDEGGEDPVDSPGPHGNPQVDEEALRNDQQD